MSFSASLDDYYSDLTAHSAPCRTARYVPPPLEVIGADVMLAVAPVRGPEPWQWREAAPGAFIAWPHAAGAGLAEEMTAGQLRAYLDERDAR